MQSGPASPPGRSVSFSPHPPGSNSKEYESHSAPGRADSPAAHQSAVPSLTELWPGLTRNSIANLSFSYLYIYLMYEVKVKLTHGLKAAAQDHGGRPLGRTCGERFPAS